MSTISPEVEKLRKRPLSDVALETLAAMVDEELLLVTSQHNSFEPKFWSMRTLKTLGDRLHPFIVDGKIFDALYRRKYIVRLSMEKMEDRLRTMAEAIGKAPPLAGDHFFSWHEHLQGVSQDGRAALELERDRLVDIRASREVEPDDRRYLVTRRIEGYNRLATLPGAGAVYRVMRETESRYYVTNLEEADGFPLPKQERWNPLVQGRSPSQFIEKAHVLKVDITPEHYSAMLRATQDFDESRARAASQMEAEMAPIRLRYAQLQEQQLAELEDGLREATVPEVGRKP